MSSDHSNQNVFTADNFKEMFFDSAEKFLEKNVEKAIVEKERNLKNKPIFYATEHSKSMACINPVINIVAEESNLIVRKTVTANTTNRDDLELHEVGGKVQEEYEALYNEFVKENCNTIDYCKKGNLRNNETSAGKSLAAENSVGTQKPSKIIADEIETSAQVVCTEITKCSEVDRIQSNEENNSFVNTKMDINKVGTTKQVTNDKKILYKQDGKEEITKIKRRYSLDETRQTKKLQNSSVYLDLAVLRKNQLIFNKNINEDLSPLSISTSFHEMQKRNNSTVIGNEIRESQDIEMIVLPIDNMKSGRIIYSPQRRNTDEGECEEVVCIESNNREKRLLQLYGQSDSNAFEEIIDVESFDIAARLNTQLGWSSEKPIDVDTLSPLAASYSSKKRKISVNDFDDECEITVLGSNLPPQNDFKFKICQTAVSSKNNIDDDDPAVVIDKLFKKLSCPVCMRNFRRPSQAQSVPFSENESALSSSKDSFFCLSKASCKNIVAPSRQSTEHFLFHSSSLLVTSSSTSGLQHTSSSAVFLSSSSTQLQALISTEVPLSSSSSVFQYSLPISCSSGSLSTPVHLLSSSMVPSNGITLPCFLPANTITSVFTSLPCFSCSSAFNSTSLSGSTFDIKPFFSDTRDSLPTFDGETSIPYNTTREFDHLPGLLTRKGNTEIDGDVDNSGTGSLAVTRCGHVFCKTCIIESLKVKKQCPLCRKILKTNQWYPLYL